MRYGLVIVAGALAALYLISSKEKKPEAKPFPFPIGEPLPEGDWRLVQNAQGPNGESGGIDDLGTWHPYIL